MKKEIELKPKKPKLAYVGMDNKTLVESVPTQVVEVVYPHRVDAPKKDAGTKLFEEGQLGTGKVQRIADLPKNRLIWTNDNLVALRTLMDEKDSVSGEYKYRNKIDLIYIDPPFMVQNDFVAENSINIEVDEEEGVMSVKEPTIIETIAYKDTWQNGLDSFLQMMRERLELMKELLAPTGSIYIHLDWHVVHYIKALTDEIFGYENFVNEIIWQGAIGDTSAKNTKFIKSHDTILFYKKSQENFWRDVFQKYGDTSLKLYKTSDDKGPYQYVSVDNPGGRGYVYSLGFGEKMPKNGYRMPKETALKWIEEGILLVRAGKVPRKKSYMGEGVRCRDVWADIGSLQGNESSGYPTQKPVFL